MRKTIFTVEVKLIAHCFCFESCVYFLLLLLLFWLLSSKQSCSCSTSAGDHLSVLSTCSQRQFLLLQECILHICPGFILDTWTHWRVMLSVVGCVGSACDILTIPATWLSRRAISRWKTSPQQFLQFRSPSRIQKKMKGNPTDPTEHGCASRSERWTTSKTS